MRLQSHSHKRVLRQIGALTLKNFLIFYKAPISTVLRAFLFPLAIALVFSYLKQILLNAPTFYSNQSGGLSHAFEPIKTLSDAVAASSSKKLVFVLNGTRHEDIDPIIAGVFEQSGLSNGNRIVTDNPDDLFTECRQNLLGKSDCFAAILFTNFNATNVNYTIALNSHDDGILEDYATHQSVTTSHIMPLQWALDSQIGNFTSAPRPLERPFKRVYRYYTSYGDPSSASNERISQWLSIVGYFAASAFILIKIGVVYHLAGHVAAERQTGLSELLAAQTCTNTPRILSTIISFSALNLPGWIACSIVIARVLFSNCSTVYFFFLSILAGISITASAHFVGSFFRKAHLSGTYASVLFMALSFVYVAFSLTALPNYSAMKALSVVFPPFTYINIIGDIAVSESQKIPWSLNTPATRSYRTPGPSISAYMYLIFFILQIIGYTAGTFLLERYLWGIRRVYDRIDATSDVALRLTNVSKTFSGSRRWYWPFVSGRPVPAVQSLNLELKKGSVSFLLGPNGGGKTTALRCIAGMTNMDNDSRLEINEAGTAFGICPQQNALFEDLTVAEHVRIWRLIKSAAINEAEIKEQEEDVLQECDLLEKRNAVVKTLSGGQKRKLQLALAFVGGSKMCCVDEATSGLDPLSRRNIWNIIYQANSRGRTVLMTTHFLDEADALADYIAILYKGRLVCTGTPTALKTEHGDRYTIREISSADENRPAEALRKETSSSASATKEILALEAASETSYAVEFPTLDQVFLKVTDSTIDEQERDAGATAQESEREIEAATNGQPQSNISLDHSHAIGFFRQVAVLLRKKYILLRHNWLSFLMALAIPIVIAAVLAKYMPIFPTFDSCEKNYANMLAKSAKEAIEKSSYTPPYPIFGALNAPGYISSLQGYDISTVVGPISAFDDPGEDALYDFSVRKHFSSSYSYSYKNRSGISEEFSSRVNVSSLDALLSLYSNDSISAAFGIFIPENESASIVYTMGDSRSRTITALNIVTNHISNTSATASEPARKVDTTYRIFRTVDKETDFRLMPLTLLITLGLIASTSVAILYPVYERINNSRALQYCNGVSPAALWLSYLLFEMQIMLLVTILTWAIVFGSATASKIWFAPNYLFGAMILFGIATYLGLFVLSLIVKKMAYAIAAGLHLLFFGLTLLAYLLNDNAGDLKGSNSMALQAGFGLLSPVANLLRAFFIAIDSFDLTCGESGYLVQDPFKYHLYGGVYANFIIQIVFLSLLLTVVEYGSSDWIHRVFSARRGPPGLKSIIEDSEAGVKEKSANDSPSRVPTLVVSKVTKYFGKLFATQNISFNVSSNEKLALLGPNGAGKTTMINMIRGLIKPNYGEIHVEGVSVRKQPQKARVYMGVCPQDDAIDELSVRQTLSFYAAMKGVRDVQKNVDRILDAFKIIEFADTPIKKLSGGTRRKLMCSIALIGNPKILLLDEPSTGQDAGAKRRLWNILSSFSANRAILLTTHSMEETEALADRVAILGSRMLASGTLTQLRNEYGGFYRIRATCISGTSEDEVAVLLRTHFGDEMSDLIVRYGHVTFRLPHETRKMGYIMKTMEGMKVVAVERDQDNLESERNVDDGTSSRVEATTRVFEDYTVTGPTMDEVFMNVCRKAKLDPM